MTVDRKTPTITDHPTDVDGETYADEVNEEIGALWGFLGGMLNAVAGTNTITASCPIPITAYTDALRCVLTPANNNSGNVTINLNGVGAKNLLDADGNPLSANALVANRRVGIEFDLGLDAFVIVGTSIGGGVNLLSSVAVFAYQTANGVDGGSTVAGSWQIYPIATSVLNDLSGEGVALSGASAFTFGPIPPGHYDFTAVVPLHQSQLGRIRLWNVTDSAVVAGLASDTIRGTTLNQMASASLRGRFTIASAKTFRLEYRVSQAKATTGLGLAASFTEVEQYGHVVITRPAEGNLGLGSMSTHNMTVSTASPSGGADGDVWFKVVP